MMEYPKTETIFERDMTTHKVRPGVLRLPEFGIPRRWLITEKIDGTNVRIVLDQGDPEDDAPAARVRYLGRTAAAQMPPFLLAALQARFSAEKIVAAFDPGTTAVIFGEGYGAKIQKGGGNYRPGAPGFRVFDVVVFGVSGRPWWLNWDGVEAVAAKIGAKTVPVVGRDWTLEDAVACVNAESIVAQQENPNNMIVPQEGIVARTNPLLFMRTGARLVWKLKMKDVLP